jgi:hypothetical protein
VRSEKKTKMPLPPELEAQLQDAGLNPNDPMVLAMLGQMFSRPPKPAALLPPAECLEGRDEPTSEIAPEDAHHFITNRPLYGPFPEHLQSIMFGVSVSLCFLLKHSSIEHRRTTLQIT